MGNNKKNHRYNKIKNQCRIEKYSASQVTGCNRAPVALLTARSDGNIKKLFIINHSNNAIPLQNNENYLKRRT